MQKMYQAQIYVHILMDNALAIL